MGIFFSKKNVSDKKKYYLCSPLPVEAVEAVFYGKDIEY